MKIIALILSVLIAASCATLNNPDFAQKLGTQYAVMKYVDRSTNPPATAARIRDIAQQVNEAIDGYIIFNTEDIRAVISKNINITDLEPADRMLASALIDAVLLDVDKAIGEHVGPIEGETAERVKVVLNDIIEATDYY